MSSGRWLAGIAAVIALVIVASAGIALMSSGGEADFPEGTPEGTVQRYIAAIRDRDITQARSYYTSDLRDRCSVQHVRDSSQWTADRLDSNRIELLDTEDGEDGEVFVRVRIVEVDVDPPFGVNEHRHEQTYTLVQEEGEWRMREPGWPVSWCPEDPEDNTRAPEAAPSP
ncbi:MAG: hypothetical protein ACOC5K_00835 [Chloroflexota bacterium]